MVCTIGPWLLMLTLTRACQSDCKGMTAALPHNSMIKLNHKCRSGIVSCARQGADCLAWLHEQLQNMIMASHNSEALHVACLLSFRRGRPTEVTSLESQQLGVQDASVLQAHTGPKGGMLKQDSSMHQTQLAAALAQVPCHLPMIQHSLCHAQSLRQDQALSAAAWCALREQFTQQLCLSCYRLITFVWHCCT